MSEEVVPQDIEAQVAAIEAEMAELLERKASEARMSPFPAPQQLPSLAQYEALAARAETLAQRLEEAASAS